MLKVDGFDDAIIGTVGMDDERVVVYDKQKMIEIRMAEGEDQTDAIEDLQFNTWGAYVGPRTPFFVDTEDWEE